MLAGREVLIGAGRAALGAVRINLLQVPTDHEADFRARASAAEAFLENPDELV